MYRVLFDMLTLPDGSLARKGEIVPAEAFGDELDRLRDGGVIGSHLVAEDLGDQVEPLKDGGVIVDQDVFDSSRIGSPAPIASPGGGAESDPQAEVTEPAGITLSKFAAMVGITLSPSTEGESEPQGRTQDDEAAPVGVVVEGGSSNGIALGGFVSEDAPPVEEPAAVVAATEGEAEPSAGVNQDITPPPFAPVQDAPPKPKRKRAAGAPEGAGG